MDFPLTKSLLDLLGANDPPEASRLVLRELPTMAELEKEFPAYRLTEILNVLVQ